MHQSSQWVGGAALILLVSACASTKAYVTVPNSGPNGSYGSAMAPVTLTPCKATALKTDTCVLQVSDKVCPFGIGRIKLERKGSDLQVTPHCFNPVPRDDGVSELDRVDTDTLEPGPSTGGHEDPGDL